ncbi:MAG: hypothetical protein K2G06_10300 [Muribaculaceae bacterium]|nr:hypothetical protein [Muribaculaceae bacterium]
MKEKNTRRTDRKVSYEDVAGPKSAPVWTIATSIGLLLIAAGTLLPILNGRNAIYRDMPDTFKYLFTAGAAIVLIARLFNTYKGKILRLKRLYRIELWSAIFFCAAAFFMFYEKDTTRNWLAFTLAGAAIQIYTSFMIPRTMRKALDGEIE